MTNDPITLQPIGYVRTDIAERRPGKNPRGGQQGHEGHTLKKAESPDTVFCMHRRRSAMRAVCCSRRRQWWKPAKYLICRSRIMKSRNTGLAAVEEACERLEPTVRASGQAIRAAPIAQADETGLRVAGRWPSYRRNAEGRANTVVTEHAEYTALGGLLEG